MKLKNKCHKADLLKINKKCHKDHHKLDAYKDNSKSYILTNNKELYLISNKEQEISHFNNLNKIMQDFIHHKVIQDINKDNNYTLSFNKANKHTNHVIIKDSLTGLHGIITYRECLSNLDEDNTHLISKIKYNQLILSLLRLLSHLLSKALL